MSEQKADKIQLEAMKLVSFELSSLLIFLYYIQYTLHIRYCDIDSFVGFCASQVVKVPTGFTTATEMHLKRSQIIQVFFVEIKNNSVEIKNYPWSLCLCLLR